MGDKLTLEEAERRLLSKLRDVDRELCEARIEVLLTEYEVMDIKLKMGFLYFLAHYDLRNTKNETIQQPSRTDEAMWWVIS